MKRRLTLLVFIFSWQLFAQVGINTDDPKALLHVNGIQDSPLPLLIISKETVTNAVMNDVVKVIIDKNGNVGINELNPTNKFVISNDVTVDGKQLTGLQLKNGARAGYKLTSDRDGNAYWNNEEIIAATFEPTSLNILEFNKDINTGVKINLPKGNWNINLGVVGELGTTIDNDTLIDLGNLNNVIDSDNGISCTVSLKYKLSDGSFKNFVLSDYYGGSMSKPLTGSIGRGMNRLIVKGNVILKLAEARSIYTFVNCHVQGDTTGFRKRIGNVFNSTSKEYWFYATPL